MATVTTSVLPDQIKTHYLMRLLMRAYPRLVHGRFAQKATLPKRAGRTLEWRRFGSLPNVLTPLSEAAWGYGGTIPAPVDPTQSTITASPAFYGAYMEYTDDVELQSIDPLLEVFTDLLGEQAGKSVDTLTRNVLAASLTNVVYGGDATDVSELATGDNMNFQVFANAAGTLLGNDAIPVDGDLFPVIMHPYIWVDLIQDDDIHKAFAAASNSGGGNQFTSGYIGDLLGFRIYMTSNANVENTGGGNGDGDVYYTIFLGQEAFGTFGLEGASPKDAQLTTDGSRPGNQTGQKIRTVDFMFVNPADINQANPLGEIGMAGWKINWGGKVLQDAWIVIALTLASLGAQPT